MELPSTGPFNYSSAASGFAFNAPQLPTIQFNTVGHVFNRTNVADTEEGRKKLRRVARINNEGERTSIPTNISIDDFIQKNATFTLNEQCEHTYHYVNGMTIRAGLVTKLIDVDKFKEALDFIFLIKDKKERETHLDNILQVLVDTDSITEIDRTVNYMRLNAPEKVEITLFTIANTYLDYEELKPNDFQRALSIYAHLSDIHLRKMILEQVFNQSIPPLWADNKFIESINFVKTQLSPVAEDIFFMMGVIAHRINNPQLFDIILAEIPSKKEAIFEYIRNNLTL